MEENAKKYHIYVSIGKAKILIIQGIKYKLRIINEVSMASKEKIQDKKTIS